MSKRTNIGRRIDAQRLSSLVTRPGVDPRVWVSLCAVQTVNVSTAGIFVDVYILSTGSLDDEGNTVAQTETVRVSADYVGSNFGSYSPLQTDDEVLVVWPDGNPDHGGVLIARLYSAADPPSSEAIANTSDPSIVVNSGKTLRIVNRSGGKTAINSDSVRLGDENATEAVMLGTSYRTAQAVLNNLVGTQLTLAGNDPIMLALMPTAAAALQAAGQAITQFEVTALTGLPPNYLSTTVKTK